MSIENVETVCANALVVLFVCINSLPRRIRLFRRSYVLGAQSKWMECFLGECARIGVYMYARVRYCIY